MTHLTELFIKGKLSVVIIASQILCKKTKVFDHNYFITSFLPSFLIPLL